MSLSDAVGPASRRPRKTTAQTAVPPDTSSGLGYEVLDGVVISPLPRLRGRGDGAGGIAHPLTPTLSLPRGRTDAQDDGLDRALDFFPCSLSPVSGRGAGVREE